MTTAEKLEKVLEYVVNDEQTKASDLLHEVFVEKAKNIYENILDDEQPVEENLEEQPEDWATYELVLDNDGIHIFDGVPYIIE